LPTPFDDPPQGYIDVDAQLGLTVNRVDLLWGPRDDEIAVFDLRSNQRPEVPRSVASAGDRYLALYGSYEDGAWQIRIAPIRCGSGAR
jgi:hypothetical protein